MCSILIENEIYIGNLKTENSEWKERDVKIVPNKWMNECYRTIAIVHIKRHLELGDINKKKQTDTIVCSSEYKNRQKIYTLKTACKANDSQK